jgi:hypothetical protein
MKTLRTLTFAYLTLLLGSCIGPLEPEVGELTAGTCQNEDSDPDVDVSFSQDLLPKFHGGCSCHSPIAPSTGGAIDSTGFSVGDYSSIRRGGQNSRDKIIVPGDPCGSFIYQKLSDAPPVGSRMPTYGPYWPASDMRLLSDWIAEGARAN